MSDFIVRFQGIELSSEQAERIQSSIQKAVFAEISASAIAGQNFNIKTQAAGNGSLVHLPGPSWRGIWYYPAALRDALNVPKTALKVVAEQE